jgi:hypothetical protein
MMSPTLTMPGIVNESRFVGIDIVAGRIFSSLTASQIRVLGAEMSKGSSAGYP